MRSPSPPTSPPALNEITSGLDLGERNRVVMADMDFPTLAYQWLRQAAHRHGGRVRRERRRITLPADRFATQIDKRTGLVATSRVFYLSGYIQDVARAGEDARTTRARCCWWTTTRGPARSRWM